jgi:glucokinase
MMVSYVLGADVGGTNTTLGIAKIENNSVDLQHILKHRTEDIDSILPSINDLLTYAKERGIEIQKCIIACAGPIKGHSTNLTNAKLEINAKEIQEKTGINTLLINDFEAIGYGINLLTPKSENKTAAIIGAGTGLGKCILLRNPNNGLYHPYPSEGGHADFPITDDRELEMIRWIRKKKSLVHVRYEDLVSGEGIELIHEFLNEEHISSKEITKNSTNDSSYSRTLEFFSKFYARCARNFVLDTLAQEIFIAGGIAADNPHLVLCNEFQDEFENSRKSDFLKTVRITILTDQKIGLKGACFSQKFGKLYNP